jgi:hypothetical protein
MGFSRVESGPLVRSSYHARRAFDPDSMQAPAASAVPSGVARPAEGSPA